jgi:DNA ligase-1
MTKQFKPLLAATIDDTADLKYPVLASPKLDGIRCIVIDGVAMSRKLKPIPNQYVQECLGTGEYDGLDGELIVGDPASKSCYHDTYSGVMSGDGRPDFLFHVFDRIDLMDYGFEDRFEQGLGEVNLPHLKVVWHVKVENEADLLQMEDQWLYLGFEGVMVRSLNGPYKYGRSTLKEGTLLKLKRFVDSEYEIVGFEERMHNGNEATKDELGNTKRSSHQENKVGRGDLGALVLRCDAGTFNCGTGFTDAMRAEIWANRDNYLGKLAKVKSFLIGVKTLPRFPTFLGFRAPEDM